MRLLTSPKLLAASFAFLLPLTCIVDAHAQTEQNAINNNYKSIRNKSESYVCHVDFALSNDKAQGNTKVTVYDIDGYMRTVNVPGVAGAEGGKLSGTPPENAKKFCAKHCSAMDYSDNINKDSGNVACGDNAGLTGFDSSSCDLSVLNVGQFYALEKSCVIYSSATGCPAYGGFTYQAESGICKDVNGNEADYNPKPNE